MDLHSEAREFSRERERERKGVYSRVTEDGRKVVLMWRRAACVKGRVPG